MKVFQLSIISIFLLFGLSANANDDFLGLVCESDYRAVDGALKRIELLKDAESDKFDVVVIHEVSGFGDSISFEEVLATDLTCRQSNNALLRIDARVVFCSNSQFKNTFASKIAVNDLGKPVLEIVIKSDTIGDLLENDELSNSGLTPVALGALDESKATFAYQDGATRTSIDYCERRY